MKMSDGWSKTIENQNRRNWRQILTVNLLSLLGMQTMFRITGKKRVCNVSVSKSGQSDKNLCFLCAMLRKTRFSNSMMRYVWRNLRALEPVSVAFFQKNANQSTLKCVTLFHFCRTVESLLAKKAGFKTTRSMIKVKFPPLKKKRAVLNRSYEIYEDPAQNQLLRGIWKKNEVRDKKLPKQFEKTS